MNILADASLPGLVTAFPPPFKLTLYHHQDDISRLLSKQNILLCRSTLRVTENLLATTSISYVATASSGIDHIDESFLKKKNISLIDAKGSNANAVADYVIATIAYLQKYTSFSGQKACIVGLGAVGSEVAKRLAALNFTVVCYDPPKALIDEKFYSASLNELVQCELMCIHANLHSTLPFPSRNLIAESILTQLKPNSAIINASRGGIVDETALLGKDLDIFYCTDVFSYEPDINPDIVKRADLCTPHIAGHSVEAKLNAVIHISQKLHQALNLPLPCYTTSLPSQKALDFKSATSWQDHILALYNPIHETNALKEAANKKEGFLTLRKAHQKRHDFSIYQAQLPEIIKPLI
jgi:erythronate-4-phosphate dehydrogenase